MFAGSLQKKSLLPELPSSIEENIVFKPTKAERQQKYEIKKLNVNNSKKIFYNGNLKKMIINF